MTDYPEKVMPPEEIYKAVNPALAVVVSDMISGIKDWWKGASVHDRKMFINMAFNNSKGSEEKALAFLEVVNESDTQLYIDYYKGCRKNAKPIEGKS